MDDLEFSVPQVQDALRDALQARPVFAGVWVDDLENKAAEQNERLAFVRVRDLVISDIAHQGGETEEYDQYLLSSIYRKDSVPETRDAADKEAAKARCWALLTDLRRLTREDRQLGGACRAIAVTAVDDVVVTRTADGWVAEALAVVHIRARSGLRPAP